MIQTQIDPSRQVKERFLETWANLSSNWGINKTMAQIHALLLLVDEPLSTEDIMELLAISRGNANMNLRALLDWSLAFKTHKKGERREYFIAEKDMWQISKNIMIRRRKNELEPLKRLVAEVKELEKEHEQPEHISETIADIEKMVQKSDRLIEKAINADRNWFTRTLTNLL